MVGNDGHSISNTLQYEHLLLYAVQHEFFTNDVIRNFQAEHGTSIQGARTYHAHYQMRKEIMNSTEL